MKKMMKKSRHRPYGAQKEHPGPLDHSEVRNVCAHKAGKRPFTSEKHRLIAPYAGINIAKF